MHVYDSDSGVEFFLFSYRADVWNLLFCKRAILPWVVNNLILAVGKKRREARPRRAWVSLPLCCSPGV